MDKSTYRFLIVLLLGVLVYFVVKGQLIISLKSSYGERDNAQNGNSEEIEPAKAELEFKYPPIGFEYNRSS